jgi:hypothetical protein
MAGYTGFTIGQVNGRHCYIPFYVSHTPAGAGHGILFTAFIISASETYLFCLN